MVEPELALELAVVEFDHPSQPREPGEPLRLGAGGEVRDPVVAGCLGAVRPFDDQPLLAGRDAVAGVILTRAGSSTCCRSTRRRRSSRPVPCSRSLGAGAAVKNAGRRRPVIRTSRWSETADQAVSGWSSSRSSPAAGGQAPQLLAVRVVVAAGLEEPIPAMARCQASATSCSSTHKSQATSPRLAPPAASRPATASSTSRREIRTTRRYYLFRGNAHKSFACTSRCERGPARPGVAGASPQTASHVRCGPRGVPVRKAA